METVRDALVSAIRQGAPIYNSGRPHDCYALYRDTAKAIVEMGVAPQYVNDSLSSAVSKSSQQQSPGDAAWTMRNCFDEILDGRLETCAQLPRVEEGAEDMTLLDFEAGISAPRWYSMDDGIMGGLSQSSMTWDARERAAVFQGNLTTANNGGFASVRSESWGSFAALQRAKGIRLIVQGDGRTYKLSAKPDDGYDGVMYQHDFETVADGRWRTMDLAFERFRPNFRGKLVPGRPPLSGAQVRQLGLMVSKFSDAGGLTSGFRTGPFKLALKSIRGFF